MLAGILVHRSMHKSSNVNCDDADGEDDDDDDGSHINWCGRVTQKYR